MEEVGVVTGGEGDRSVWLVDGVWGVIWEVIWEAVWKIVVAIVRVDVDGAKSQPFTWTANATDGDGTVNVVPIHACSMGVTNVTTWPSSRVEMHSPTIPAA